SEKAEALDPPEVEVDMFEEIAEVSVENTASTPPDESGDFSGLDEIETTKQPEIKKTMLARDSDIQSALGDSGLNAPDFGMGSLDEESPAPSPKKTQLASKQSKHTQFAPAGSELNIEIDAKENNENESNIPSEKQETPLDEEVPSELNANDLDSGSSVEQESVQEPEAAETAANEDDDISKYIDEPSSADEESTSEDATEMDSEETVVDTELEAVQPRKRGGILIGTLVGTILGAGIFGGLYEFGIEIPQEFRMNKSEAVIALENGKKRAESDAKSKADEVVKIKEEAAKADDDYKTKEKVFLAKHEAELKKAADDKKIALDEADKTYKDSLKDAEKKLADQKAEADKTLKETMVAADKKIKETEDTAKKEIAEEKKATEKKLTEADTKYTMLKGEKTKVDEALKKSEDFVASIGSELAQANLVKDKFNPVNVVDGLKKGMEIIQSKDP
ncbi:hypothetical protein EBX93_16860, partial [bacterium]|nr:hypothetical protein [bacterium]